MNANPYAHWYRQQHALAAGFDRTRREQAAVRAKAAAEEARRLAARSGLEREREAINAAGRDWLARAQAQVNFWLRELKCTVTWLPNWTFQTQSEDLAHRPHVRFVRGRAPHVTGPVVRDLVTYLVILHELAHAATYRPGIPVGEFEAVAWRWVQGRAISWSPRMDATLARCLHTYRFHAVPGDGVMALVEDAKTFGETRRRLDALTADVVNEKLDARIRRQKFDRWRMRRRETQGATEC